MFYSLYNYNKYHIHALLLRKCLIKCTSNFYTNASKISNFPDPLDPLEKACKSKDVIRWQTLRLQNEYEIAILVIVVHNWLVQIRSSPADCTCRWYHDPCNICGHFPASIHVPLTLLAMKIHTQVTRLGSRVIMLSVGWTTETNRLNRSTFTTNN